MSGKLWKIVEEHIDKYGPTEAAVARRLGISSSGLHRWKTGNPPPLPRPANLHRLAELTGKPFRVVLEAALDDAGYGDDGDGEPGSNGSGDDARAI